MELKIIIFTSLANMEILTLLHTFLLVSYKRGGHCIKNKCIA